MTYQFYQGRKEQCYITERHSRSKIAYYSKQKMKELYPEGDYEIVGEINNFIIKYSITDEIFTEGEKRIPIFPRGSYKKPFEWIDGYAAVKQNTYVAVIKSIIPRLFYLK